MQETQSAPRCRPETGGKEPNVVGRFCERPHLNLVKSREQDREIHEPATFVEIKVKGSVDLSSIRVKPKAIGEYATRFPSAWEEYQKKTTVEHDGTPLNEFEGMSADKALKFKAGGVYTLEDVANMDDMVCQNSGSAHVACGTTSLSFWISGRTRRRSAGVRRDRRTSQNRRPHMLFNEWKPGKGGLEARLVEGDNVNKEPVIQVRLAGRHDYAGHRVREKNRKNWEAQYPETLCRAQTQIQA